MSTTAPRPLNLARVEGFELLTAAEALLKGILESEVPVHLLAGARRGPLPGLFELASDERIARLLVDHGLVMAPTPEALRALTLAEQVARSRRRALAIADAGDLDALAATLARVVAQPVRDDGALVLLLADVPAATGPSPAALARRFDLPCLAPVDLAELRDAVERAFRIARAGERPAIVALHGSLLHAADTMAVRANRVVETLQLAEALRQGRRGPRPGEGLDPLRMARRLELNAAEAMPSPGETAPLGLIAVGPARMAVRHVLHELRLAGRVPVLHLGLVHPIDEAVVERLLGRCAEVVVLEPRPGCIGPGIAAIAERLRRRGAAPGLLWWEELPPDGDAPVAALGPDEATRPSILVRRLLHLLHEVRPGLKVADRLAAADTEPTVAPPPRAGPAGARAGPLALRALLEELDAWARDRAEDAEEGPGPTAVAIDGVEPVERPGRLVVAEIWDGGRLLREGAGAIRQAASSPVPRILLVLDRGDEEQPDAERLVRALAPGERGERVRIESATLADRTALRDRLREAVLGEGLTVVVVRDPRARGAEGTAAEIDRLGFQPLQRIVWSADLACDLRPRVPAALGEGLGARTPVPFEHRVRSERVSERIAGAPRLRLRPLLEQLEVVRTRPPRPRSRFEGGRRLAPPRAEHGQQGLWRAHVAGVRGRGLGAVAEVLCDAGRTMGYHVRCLANPAPIGPGRRAWTQVLFTRPRPDEAAPPLVGGVPYGEADLLLGVDPVETLRAIGPDPDLRVAGADRTAAVVNAGLLEDQLEEGLEEVVAALGAGLGRVARPERLVAEDIAAACREDFLTDRVVDLVLLGSAFQRGLVPVSVEAIEGAVRRLEARGVGRAVESFAYGRQLGSDERPPRRPEDAQESVERLIRRLELELRRRRGRGGGDGAALAQLARATVAQTPGLAETPAGREAQRDLVLALRRCMAWGGLDIAQRFAEQVRRLYDADRGDHGREITRLAILPLADAMLSRDLVYLAAMATSLEHRRRTRQRLGVRLARGDELRRRYLNRLDVAALGWRLRIDFRTSDWPARAIAILGRLLPRRARGAPEERAVREYVLGLVDRIAADGGANYRRWLQSMRRLHETALATRLRGLGVEALRERVEGEGG